MPSRLYLVRHGETDWSQTGRHTSRTEVSLSAAGRERARSLEPRFRAVNFVRVFSSPRQRAQETCALAGLGGRVETEPDLAEWNYGDYEGLRSSEIARTRPGWNLFRDGCPNGESPAEISARADRLIARLRALPGNVALFSHGHFGRVLAVRWIGLPVLDANRFLFGTAALGILDFEHENPAAPVIALWNDGPGAAT